MNRQYPVSVINHNTIIPKNNARYRESFNTVIMPRDNVYKITSITCKIDTTSLWNIRSTNVVKIVDKQGHEMIYNVNGGYYTISELCNAVAGSIAINDKNLAYVVDSVADSVDLTDASDIASIFRLGDVLRPGTIASEPFDITNGQSVIRVYSSINAQTFGLNSPLIDNLIHVSMGLNNMITWDNLSIDVIEQSNWDYIDWMLTDANNNPISLNSNVYISFTISCYPKVK